MCPPRYNGPLNIPEFGHIVLEDHTLNIFIKVRPSLFVSRCYLLFSGQGQGGFFFVYINEMGRDMGQTRNPQCPL